VIVDNRGAVTSIETAAKAAPDGYTLIYYGSLLWLLPLLRDKVSWDPIRDFSPITLAVTAPNVLVVHPSDQSRS
jgi:tripartite-type tricarboxylate transporter receptor subunit TctC